MKRRHDRGEYDLRQPGEASAALRFMEAVVAAAPSLPEAEAKTDGLAALEGTQCGPFSFTYGFGISFRV